VSERRGSELVAGLFVFAATCFNCVLCLIDTKLFAIPQAYVILCEIVIVSATLLYSIMRWNAAMMPMTLLLLLSTVLWLGVSLLTQEPNLLIIRDMIIPPVFLMLGIATASTRLPKFVIYLLLLVFAMAVFEAVAPLQFTRLLNIENYYIGTRGYTSGQFYNQQSELFASATRPDQRYMLPFLNIHRLSSIFLEPVSLGNYVVIVFIILLAYKEAISLRLFWPLLALDGMILIGSDGRLALSLCVILLLAARVIARFPRWGSLFVLPAVFITVLTMVTALGFVPGSDDLQGRTASTVYTLLGMDAGNWLGLTSKDSLNNFMDSGLSYFIASQSPLGLALLWIAVFGTGPASRRGLAMHYGAALYLSMTMIVSYSLFTIKTAALLWYMVGCSRDRDLERGADLGPS
jgi:putative polymerase